MGFNFIVYFEKLELLAFFSGFPIIFLLVFWCFGSTKKQVLSWLPLSYALAGTLYISYVIYNGASHSLVDLSSLSLITALKTWSLFSLLFWIPFFRKRIAWPFIHSLFFLVPLLMQAVSW
jgi:hypothetical protein